MFRVVVDALSANRVTHEAATLDALGVWLADRTEGECAVRFDAMEHGRSWWNMAYLAPPAKVAGQMAPVTLAFARAVESRNGR